MSFTVLAERFNLFLYSQNVRKLSASEIELAREWSMNLIRKEHPEFSEEQAGKFYENLIHVRISAVDEWTRRMS